MADPINPAVWSSVSQFSHLVVFDSCNPMDCSMPGFAVHQWFPEFAQTYVHQVGDAIQPSHPLLSPSPPAHNYSQYQGFFLMRQIFPSGGRSIGASVLASVLPMSIQDWTPLGWTGCSSRDSQQSSTAPQFKSINSSVLSSPYGATLTSIHDYWKNHNFDYLDICQQSKVSSF